MSIFSGSYSDPFPQLPELSWSSDFLESYSSSPLSEEVLQSVIVNSSEKQSKLDFNEVMLASKNPKKRAGRIKFRETRHPVYRGVRRRNGDKWVCEVREPNKKSRIWLGTFPTAEMAARAHDVAVIALRGKSACVNFADSFWRLPVPVSSNAKDIQRAAAEAAELFRPSESNENELSIQASPPPSDGGGGAETSLLSENVSTYFKDDEVFFDMPGFMSDMAVALMLPQPPSHCGILQEDADVSVSLWSYSSSFFDY